MLAERRRRGQAGITYLELVATVAIVMIMALAILPTTRVVRKRQRELELRRALREMRTAIDRFKLGTEQGKIGGIDLSPDSEGYPKDLEILVKGVSQVGAIDKKLKFLRRIPVDPMTGAREWGLRCYQDTAESDSWCGRNVYDVYTKASGKGLDGIPYREW